MTKKITWFLVLFTYTVLAQQNDTLVQFSHFTTAEFLFGKTKDANSGFPETNLQNHCQLVLETIKIKTFKNGHIGYVIQKQD